MSRRLAANAARVYGVQALSGMLGVLFVPVALRHLHSEGYALWSVYGLLQGYIVLAELGLGKYLVQQLAATTSAERRVELLRLAATAYAVVSGILLLTVPLLWFGVGDIFSVPEPLVPVARWIAVLAVLDYVAGLPLSLRQSATVAAQDFGRYATFAGLSSVLRFGLPVLAVVAGASPLLTVAAAVGRRIPEWFVGRHVLAPLPRGLWPFQWRGEALREMVQATLLLSLAQVLQITMVSVSALLIGWQGDFASLGGFRAMFDLVSKVWFVSSGLGLVLYPHFSRIAAQPNGAERLGVALATALRASWVGYWILGVVGTVLGGALALRVGVVTPATTSAFALLIIGMVCNAHANVAYELMQASQRLAHVLRVNVVGITALVLGTLWLPVPSAIERAAVAWAGSQVLYALIVDTVAMRSTSAPADLVVHRLIVAAIGSILLIVLRVPEWWPVGIAAALIGAWLVQRAIHEARASWQALGGLA
jgi:O-antigen/teichoic acid export membrane protein